MPKEYDVKRNYYADLELPASASIDDVKKQYRKLALVYHPDRNAGKELECIPKFQAIQAAHEILGDPAKKILYDADRRRQFTSAAPAPAPRGNPYQASSNFPPPPRRTQPGEWKRPQSSQSRPQPNGANRFSSFAGAPPPPPPRADPTQDRTNMFRAWQNMGTAQDRQQPRNNAGSGPSASNTQAPRRPQPPPRNDTKYPTEEPLRPSRSHQFDADGADGRRSAWEAFNRSQAPQPGVKRSNTARTPRKQGFDPNAPGSDERPTVSSHYSHRHKSEDFGQSFATASPGDQARSARRPNIDPTKPNRPSANDDAPYSEANRERTPYSSFIGEKTDFSSNLRRSKSSRDTAAMNNAAGAARPRSTSPRRDGGEPNQKTFDFNSTDSEAGTPGSDGSGSAADSAFSRRPTFHRPGERPKKVPSPPSRRFDQHGGRRASSRHDQPSPSDNIFSFNGAAPFSPPPMPNGKSRSEENINLKFAQPWTGVFEGSPTATTPQSPNNRSTYNKQNGKVRSTFGQPSPLRPGVFANSIPPPPPGPAPNPNANISPTSNQFSKEQHEEAFRNFQWTVPPPPPLQQTTTNESMQSTGKSPDDANRQFYNRNADPPSASVEDEMDIDDSPPGKPAPPPPATDTTAAMPPPAKPIRMVSVPPSQWHQQQTGTSQHVRAASSSQSPTTSAPLRTNLDSLKHVEPLARPADGGLNNLSGLSMNLPFKSEASNVLPSQQPESEKPLSLPQVPKLPPPPQHLTRQTWHGYATAFSIYLQHFHTFNAQLLRHFATREALAERKMSQGMGWLEATGDLSGESGSNGPTGFTAYAREVEEDARVREVWSVGCDRHLQAVKTFNSTREKVRRLVTGGGLAER